MAEKNRLKKIEPTAANAAGGENPLCQGAVSKNNRESDLTPLMNQYQSVKSAHPDYIVFFRLGDFYEMFGEDAIMASPILGVVLTKRQNVPMCGVPHHSASNYIKTLLNAGKKVAICEQTSETATSVSPGGKKLITREVVRLITPGTVWEENLLDVRRNNYILAMIFSSQNDKDASIGIAAADISSSDCFLSEAPTSNIISEITRTNAKEIIVPETQKILAENFISDALHPDGKSITISTMPDWHFDEGRAIAEMSALQGIKTWDSIDPPTPTKNNKQLSTHALARRAMGGLLSYLKHIKFEGIENTIARARFKRNEDFLYISHTTMRALEILTPMRATDSPSSHDSNTLVGLLDETKTPMGSRLLISFITAPLTDEREINRRLDAVSYFVENNYLRCQLRDALKSIADIERILTRISAKSATPREIFHLGSSIKKALALKKIFTSHETVSPSFIPEIVEEILSTLSSENTLGSIISLIDEAIEPERSGVEGGFIKTGYNKELDDIRKFSEGARDKILDIERREKERTGISSLKIGYTSVFGYYVEIRKTNLSRELPSDYTRKQTLAAVERFTIPELMEIENRILHAEENISRLEKEILSEIREKIRTASQEILKIAKAIAVLDTLSTFAEVAVANNWARPLITPSDDKDSAIELEDLRHPVVESCIGRGRFVPNDVRLSNKENQILLVTGPNMGGKSTYLRQTAISVILAQSGSFVPAKKARMSIVDKIFTRIGTSDNLAAGESTFMTEMMETATIIREMTPRSLVILDEVGRGTSTFDGISIAWAIIEHLHRHGDETSGGPKVLFATHYFELTELASKLPRLKNLHVSATEWKNEVVFLYKIEPGAADRSYGIHVAKLAGMPVPIIKRSREILSELESNSHQLLKIGSKTSTSTARHGRSEQMDFEDFIIFDKLKNVDVNELTPIEALNILAGISSNMKRRKL